MSTMTEAALACCRTRTRGVYVIPTHTWALPPSGGPHLPGWAWAAIIGYLVIHVLAGHARHRLGRRRVSYGWSVLRGPWFSVRLTRHLRWRS